MRSGTSAGVTNVLTAVLQGHKAGAAEADARSVQSNTPSSVKVAVMVRPMLPFEQQKGGSRSVMVYPPDKVSNSCPISYMYSCAVLHWACSRQDSPGAMAFHIRDVSSLFLCLSANACRSKQLVCPTTGMSSSTTPKSRCRLLCWHALPGNPELAVTTCPCSHFCAAGCVAAVDTENTSRRCRRSSGLCI